MIYGFQRRYALVGLVLLTGGGGQIGHVPHVAVARLQIQGIVQLVGQTDAGQRRDAGVAVVQAVGMGPVGTRFTEQGEIFAKGQTGDTGQGRALVLVTLTIGTTTASVLVTQFGTEGLVEVVTHEEVGRGGIFSAGFDGSVVQAVEVSGTDTGTKVDVVGSLSGCGCQCQCNPDRGQS
ncbi:hypothetical protein D3C71_1328300 [compost metagenome]